MEYGIGAVIGLLLGAVISYFLTKKDVDKKNEQILAEADKKATEMVSNAKRQATSLVKDAEKEGESIKKEKILQAKEKFLEMKAKHEESINQRDRKINEAEKRIKEKEHKLNEGLHENKKTRKALETEKQTLEEKKHALERKTEEVNATHNKQVQILEKISGYSAEEARSELVESLRDEAKTKAQAHVQEIMAEAQMNSQNEARKIVIQAIQLIGT